MQTDFFLALLIFVATYSAIIASNLKKSGFPIWLIMSIGAVLMVLSGIISVEEAYSSINLRVIVFLFSMLVFAASLEISGAIEIFAIYLLSKARNAKMVLLMILLGIGLLSAILMNDTLALIGTPLMLELAKRMKISPQPVLITLAFSVTIGSVMTPIGNPQNLLIALESNMRAPFVYFLYYLTAPTLINIFITYLILSRYFSKEISISKINFKETFEFDKKMYKYKDENLAKISFIILTITILAILTMNVFELLGYNFEFSIAEISLVGAIILLAFSNRRREILTRLDWSILVLFAALFVLMQALSKAGIISFLSNFLPALNPKDSASISHILIASVLLSQVLSNVPFVTIYLPILKEVGYTSTDVSAWIALAAGSTLAGNLTIIGAASNLIILESAENRGYKVSFLDFFKIGWIVTLVNVIVIFVFLTCLNKAHLY
jgi:Na+/H+ antiporter NhaD/arsenite permease-like protein